MKALKVPLKHAQKVKKKLIETKLFDNRFLVKKSDNFLYMPLLSDPSDFLSRKPRLKVENVTLKRNTKVKKYQEHLVSTLRNFDQNNLPKSYDVIGDIILIDIPKELSKKEKQIAKALLKTHKNIKTVFKKRGSHKGEFRIQALKFLAGENKTVTQYRENYTILKVDVEKVYFSPRLSTERKRIYLQIKPKETVLVMFSGTGIYPLVIAKNTKADKIIGIEKNPAAHKLALENIKLNKLTNVEFLYGDVNKVIPRLNKTFDRIIMPLPKGAETFLDIAFLAAKKNTIIHFYDFQSERDINKTENIVVQACKRSNWKCKILRIIKCGQYSPGIIRACVDFQLVL